MLNFVIPRGDKGEDGKDGEDGNGSSISGCHLVIKKFDVDSSSGSFIIPKGANEIYVSGCGGGGGLTYSKAFDAFTSGWNGAYVIDQKVDTEQGDVFSIIVGEGGKGSTSQSATAIGERGGDTIIKKNENEIIRLAGGNGGQQGSNAGNQTGQSRYDDVNAWGFDPSHSNGFGGGELSSKVRYALSVCPTPLFPFGIGGSLTLYGQYPVIQNGYGTPGIVFFKYIQIE